MASRKNMPILCILMLFVAATIASASSNYGNGYGNNAPKIYKKDVLSKGLVPAANIIAVQGMIYCKSGSKLIPLKVFALKELKEYDQSCKITQCKAFLESSSLESCDVPTDENKGKTGALLTSYRLLNGKKSTLFYSVDPFVYTSDDSNYKREGY
ncbi:hypothetical protein RND71_022837 [Anisodus tanguticus]|uniref:Uncharacterized protein n=1 Tax=Anisodus tanguticus TaxID=243964 RepID=A0AAE1RUF6_9SOLA|nr:hypothetical protein RND71_022837 [Anisodus tanguticus]